MTKFLIAAITATILAGCGNMPGSPGGPTRSVGEVVDDATIATKLKAAYAADPELSALKINVDTAQGVVRLKGEIKSVVLRQKAEATARKIGGVKSVENMLIVTG
jgi:hyperosmotically inducible protein